MGNPLRTYLNTNQPARVEPPPKGTSKQPTQSNQVPTVAKPKKQNIFSQCGSKIKTTIACVVPKVTVHHQHTVANDIPLQDPTQNQSSLDNDTSNLDGTNDGGSGTNYSGAYPSSEGTGITRNTVPTTPSLNQTDS